MREAFGLARRVYPVTKKTRRPHGARGGQRAAAPFFAGAYSNADIATFPWVARHDLREAELAGFFSVERWFAAIAPRRTVGRGMAVPS